MKQDPDSVCTFHIFAFYAYTSHNYFVFLFSLSKESTYHNASFTAKGTEADTSDNYL